MLQCRIVGQYEKVDPSIFPNLFDPQYFFLILSIQKGQIYQCPFFGGLVRVAGRCGYSLLWRGWRHVDCTLEHCPKSSKSLPGMPPGRTAFTQYERFNLKWRGDYVTLSAPVTDVWVYRVTKTNDGTLEAIVGIGITRCAIDSDGYSFTTEI